MKNNILKVLGFFLVGMVGGIFADQIFWPFLVERPLFYKYRLEQQPVYLTEEKEFFIQENTALRDSLKKVEKTVVGVKSQSKAGKTRQGSGLILTSDGLVCTLAELAPEGSQLNFFLEGEEVPSEIIERKEGVLLARLEKTGLATVNFENSSDLGEKVFLLGFLFDSQGEQIKIANSGIIKYIEESLLHTNIFENYLLSGAPVFNLEGSALGLSQIDSQGKVTVYPVSEICRIAGL